MNFSSTLFGRPQEEKSKKNSFGLCTRCYDVFEAPANIRNRKPLTPTPNENKNSRHSSATDWPQDPNLIKLSLTHDQLIHLKSSIDKDKTRNLRFITNARFFVSKLPEGFITVKEIKNKTQIKRTLKQEIEIHYKMQNAGMPVAKLYGFYYNPNNESYVAYEYAEKGDLFEKLQKCKNPWKPERFKYLQREIYSIGKAISYMHDNGVVHKDISLENILIDRYRRFLLHDFGDCEQFNMNQADFSTSIWAGKETYMSPENFDCRRKRRKNYDAFANDVWSYGVVLMSCYTDGVLWNKADNQSNDYNNIINNLRSELETAFQINAHHHDPIVKSSLKELIDLLICIFVPENIRPSMEMILNHTFFDSVRYSSESSRILRNRPPSLSDNNIETKPRSQTAPTINSPPTQP